MAEFSSKDRKDEGMKSTIITINLKQLPWAEMGLLSTIDMLTGRGKGIHLRELYDLTSDSEVETTRILMSLSQKNCLPNIKIDLSDGLIKDMYIQGFSEATDVSQN
jgi:hypothetical protein